MPTTADSVQSPKGKLGCLAEGDHGSGRSGPESCLILTAILPLVYLEPLMALYEAGPRYRHAWIGAREPVLHDGRVS